MRPYRTDSARSHRGSRSARPLRVGLVLSGLVHVALLLLLRFDGPDTQSASHASDAGPVLPSAMHVYDIQVIDGAVPPASSIRDVQSEAPVVMPPIIAPAVRAPSARRSRSGSVAARVAPRVGDRRLWVGREVAMEPDPSPLERERARIADRVDTFHDSLAAAALADAAPTDWTSTGPDGRRWGASTGAFHIGDMKLPYCSGHHAVTDCGFGAPPGRLEEFQTRLKTFDDIETQRERATADSILKSRIDALRAVRRKN